MVLTHMYDVQIQTALQDYLLFANRQFLAKINRDGTGVQAIRLTSSGQSAPNAVAVDYDIR